MSQLNITNYKKNNKRKSESELNEKNKIRRKNDTKIYKMFHIENYDPCKIKTQVLELKKQDLSLCALVLKKIVEYLPKNKKEYLLISKSFYHAYFIFGINLKVSKKIQSAFFLHKKNKKRMFWIMIHEEKYIENDLLDNMIRWCIKYRQKRIIEAMIKEKREKTMECVESFYKEYINLSIENNFHYFFSFFFSIFEQLNNEFKQNFFSLNTSFALTSQIINIFNEKNVRDLLNKYPSVIDKFCVKKINWNSMKKKYLNVEGVLHVHIVPRISYSPINLLSFKKIDGINYNNHLLENFSLLNLMIALNNESLKNEIDLEMLLRESIDRCKYKIFLYLIEVKKMDFENFFINNDLNKKKIIFILKLNNMSYFEKVYKKIKNDSIFMYYCYSHIFFYENNTKSENILKFLIQKEKTIKYLEKCVNDPFFLSPISQNISNFELFEAYVTKPTMLRMIIKEIRSKKNEEKYIVNAQKYVKDSKYNTFICKKLNEMIEKKFDEKQCRLYPDYFYIYLASLDIDDKFADNFLVYASSLKNENLVLNVLIFIQEYNFGRWGEKLIHFNIDLIYANAYLTKKQNVINFIKKEFGGEFFHEYVLKTLCKKKEFENAKKYLNEYKKEIFNKYYSKNELISDMFSINDHDSFFFLLIIWILHPKILFI